MQISLHLHWISSAAHFRKAFKSRAAEFLYQDYMKRLSTMTSVQTMGASMEHTLGGYKTWVCNSSKSDSLSSEDLARALLQLMNQGTKILRIAIGGASGFSKGQITQMNPDKIWSFGPLTLPHELASIVACEQLYRAFSILRGLPYHLKH